MNKTYCLENEKYIYFPQQKKITAWVWKNIRKSYKNNVKFSQNKYFPEFLHTEDLWKDIFSLLHQQYNGHPYTLSDLFE